MDENIYEFVVPDTHNPQKSFQNEQIKYRFFVSIKKIDIGNC